MKNTQTITKEDVDLDAAIKKLFERNLVLYNDDVNTFEHVIECLMTYCKHVGTQAEQCALIVHSNGKCGIKTGRLEVLQPIAEALLENQLSVKIE